MKFDAYLAVGMDSRGGNGILGSERHLTEDAGSHLAPSATILLFVLFYYIFWELLIETPVSNPNNAPPEFLHSGQKFSKSLLHPYHSPPCGIFEKVRNL